jgi:uncharacterized RDD family membrane protein YckC
VYLFVRVQLKKTFMTGKTLRFINFLLDSGIFFLLLVLFIVVFKNVIAIEHMKWISGVLYFSYYFISESINGQTIGKMITKTKAVSIDETAKFSAFRLFIRTIMRFIPIDILSYLFTYRGLHDLASKTTVIKLSEMAGQK